jgi:hypothetical protein
MSSGDFLFHSPQQPESALFHPGYNYYIHIHSNLGSMKYIVIYACIFFNFTATLAQKYVKESGTISFFSAASLEDIKADNAKAVSLFNSTTGDIAYSVPIADFQFKKSLMQEHFNEKYLESDKYPKANFQGKIVGFDLTEASIQNVTATGKLTIHGVTQDISVPGTFEVKNSKLLLQSKFKVKLEDYKVEIPKLMWQNIAEEVDVTINFTYKAQ